MKGLLIVLAVLAILALIIGYSYVTVSNGPIEPVGRLAFVKLANPDMYPGHAHAQLVENLTKEYNSKTVLVVHMAGGANYCSYQQGDVYVITVAFIDTQGIGSASLNQINFLDSLKVALFGVPDGRYKYMSDGVIYNSYDEMMNHVNKLAKEHGQQGPIPMFWHGTVRNGTPILTPGCGFPLYFQILTKNYGIIPAYTYMVSGLIYPYLKNPFRNFEIQNATQLQDYYNKGLINNDYSYVEDDSATAKYYQYNQENRLYE